ncbi:uncharacterized protein OCT59_024694 [Rhizophagus irregularis]|uniref:uncharacterized protein n=1 Tax=Rhizophagus irregularis TaxID=588596 RepID=UPI003325EC72|nr:hypothetical protein OCT59_024694 [Rhizophagus irregularis]
MLRKNYSRKSLCFETYIYSFTKKKQRSNRVIRRSRDKMKTSYKFNSSKDDIIVDIGICTCLMLKTLDLDYKELEAGDNLLNIMVK